MATLAKQSIKRTGVDPSYAAAAGGGDKFTPGENVFLHVLNGGVGSITVTVVTPKEAFPDVAEADVAVAVANGAEKMIGPFPASHFANPSDSGLAAITYSGVTSVTVAVLELVQP